MFLFLQERDTETRSLQVRWASDDICGRLLVSSTAFAGFVVDGVVLLGSNVDEFATFWRGSILRVRPLIGEARVTLTHPRPASILKRVLRLPSPGTQPG